MKNTLKSALAGGAVLLVSACTSVPPIEEMQQLDGDSLRGMLVGNTISGKYDWGTWYRTFGPDLSGNALAVGNGWREKAGATSTLSDDGEVCSIFSGDPDWSKPEHRYCDTYHQDAEGNLYTRVTENTRRPERVGRVAPLKILSGDPKKLNESSES